MSKKILELHNEIKELEAQKKKYVDYYDEAIRERQEVIDAEITKRKLLIKDGFYEDDEIIIYEKLSEKQVIDALKVLSNPEALKYLIAAKEAGKCNISITKPYQKVLSQQGFNVGDYLNITVEDKSTVVIKGAE